MLGVAQDDLSGFHRTALRPGEFDEEQHHSRSAVEESGVDDELGTASTLDAWQGSFKFGIVDFGEVEEYGQSQPGRTIGEGRQCARTVSHLETPVWCEHATSECLNQQGASQRKRRCASSFSGVGDMEHSDAGEPVEKSG
jgi:hypothetical protein